MSEKGEGAMEVDLLFGSVWLGGGVSVTADDRNLSSGGSVGSGNTLTLVGGGRLVACMVRSVKLSQPVGAELFSQDINGTDMEFAADNVRSFSAKDTVSEGDRRRLFITQAKRIVVKVGSSSITGDNAAQLPALVAAIMKLYQNGCEVLLVSSGAIASALPYLGLQRRPYDSLALQQAAAAVGQSRLMVGYHNLFDAYRVVCGQVLLTAEDMERSESRQNARAALGQMLKLGIVPIINENDVVSTAEIRFGDNDTLAALVARLMRADLLVLFSDVEALYTHPPEHPKAQAIAEVPYGDSLEQIEVTPGGKSQVGSGGAVTKLAAARLAADEGIPTLLAATCLADLALSGQQTGTWFHARADFA